MTSLRLIAGLGAALLGIAAASPGFAMSGECFWRHLSQPTRDAFLKNYGRLGAEVLDRVAVDDADYAQIDSACGAASADPATKDRLLAASVIEHGSAVFLEGRLHWDADAIQAAWSRLPPEDLDGLHGQASQVLRGQAPGEADVSGPARRFVGNAAGEDRDVLAQARAYVTSRAMRETIEQASGG